MTISTYQLKSKFQQLLRPIETWLINKKISPNQITITTCLLSVLYAILLAINPSTTLLLLLPVFMLLRMALNALDGMIAVTTHSQSKMGSVLNEVCDVISDLVLLGAFLVFIPVTDWLWYLLIVLSILTEFVSLATFQAIEIRSFTGPFGKSDRATFLSVVALLLAFIPNNPALFTVLTSVGIFLAMLTCYNRLKPVLER